MRTMYDAVSPANIPATATMVAGYINGPYAWTQAEWDRFPNASKVEISVRAADRRGHVLDVESGANMPTPADAPPWVAARRAAGADPTVYCNYSTWPLVRAAFQNAGIPEPHYWIAKYDKNPAIPAGAVAKQHTNTAAWDLSSVADYWPGVDPAPEADVATTNDDVALFMRYNILVTGGNPAGTVATGDYVNVGDVFRAVPQIKAEVDALKAANVAPVAVVDVAAIAKAVADLLAARIAS